MTRQSRTCLPPPPSSFHAPLQPHSLPSVHPLVTLYFIASLPILSPIVTRFSAGPHLLLPFSFSHFFVLPPVVLLSAFHTFSLPPILLSSRRYLFSHFPFLLPFVILLSASPLPPLSPPVSLFFDRYQFAFLLPLSRISFSPLSPLSVPLTQPPLRERA